MTATPAPALSDRTGASDEEFAARIAPFGIFQPEEREAAVVESVARALWDVDQINVCGDDDCCTWESMIVDRCDQYRTLAVAAVSAYRAAQDGADAEGIWLR